MAWNELFRQRYEGYTLEGNYTDASGVSRYAKVVCDLEVVIEHSTYYDICSMFTGKILLHIVSVNASETLYLKSYDTRKYSKFTDTTKEYYFNKDYLTLSPGQSLDNVLLVEFLNEKSVVSYAHNFVDGKTSLNLSFDPYLGLYCYNPNSYGGRGSAVAPESFRIEVALDEDTLPTLNKSAQIVTANNFTDEENNPQVTYTIPYLPNSATISSSTYTLTKRLDSSKRYPDKSNYLSETVSVQIGLSLDGETLDIPYRDAPVNGDYTFNLTEDELDILRAKTQGSNTVPIYYMFKTTRTLHVNRNGTVADTDFSQVFYSKEQRNFTVVGCNPQLNPTVKDINPETLALTGDENTFVRYESMAEYAINATASKHATIVSQSVTCGSKTIENLPYGVIDDVESADFQFYVVDSRGMAASSAVFKNLVEYIKPTCYQKAEIEITGETGATIKLIVGGNYFNDSFGAVDNTLTLEVRHTDGNNNWGNWTTFNVTPTFNDNTYELEVTFNGFDYGKAYAFQSRITDKLNFVESAQYVVSMKPVFDWSAADFNFNVPVNINANNLDMHGKTVLKHNEIGNNVVLSAYQGNIYIRPGGTDNTSGETIIYSNGKIKFGGEVTFSDGTTGGGDPLGALGDYVIEAGSDSMGSNGTWYWRKWASGTAEAWGCRNFGRMAITTAWGNLYRSEIFTQDLPYNVFIRTPDAININIVHSNFGGWICKHEETAPSADTTGSFIFVRPASATATPTNIGFYVVGEWK